MNNEQLILQNQFVIMEALLFLIPKPTTSYPTQIYDPIYSIRSDLIDAQSNIMEALNEKSV